MKKLMFSLTVMLMALCLFGFAGFAAGAPPGDAVTEFSFDIAAIMPLASVAQAIQVATLIEGNTIVTHAGGGSTIASAVITHHNGGDTTKDKTDSALVDHSHSALTDHVRGGCTCFTFGKPIIG